MPTANKEWVKPVTKALRDRDKPINHEHIQKVIELTHRTLDLRGLWLVADSQPVMSKRFSAWKLCYLYHRVLRDGHPAVLKDGDNVARLRLSALCTQWTQHQKYHLEIHRSCQLPGSVAWYCRLLMKKLQFHATYPFVNGKMRDTNEGDFGQDMDTCVQMCIDALDMIECMLAVQHTVFLDMKAHRIKSAKSKESRMRIAPLHTIAAECTSLYRLIVTALGHAHLHMSAEMLREMISDRFDWTGEQVNSFYKKLHEHDATFVVPIFSRPTRYVVAAPASQMYPNLPEPTAPNVSEFY